MPQVELLHQNINTDAISLTEALIERLRSGQTVAVAFVEVSRDRSVSTVYANAGGSYHLLNSGAARLSVQIAGLRDWPRCDIKCVNAAF